MVYLKVAEMLFFFVDMLDQPGGGGHPETSAADPRHGGCRRSPHQYRHRRLCQGQNLGVWELNLEIQGLNRVRTSCLVVGAHGKGSTSTTCFFYDLSQLSLFGIPGPSSIALSKNKVVANRWQRGGSKHPHPGCEILHDIGIN